MVWFTLSCLVGGAIVGWLFRSPLFVAITSFQILACVFGFWMGGVITGEKLILFSLSGLFVHQSAYLAALVGRVFAQEARAESEDSVVSKFESDLTALDRLARNIAIVAPSAEKEATKLSRLVADIRGALNDDQRLEQLILERRRWAS